MEIWRREKGSTILLAILVLAVGSALVISLAQTKQNSISSAIAQERSTRALDLAESGLETVCQQARAHIMDGKDLSNFSTEQLTDQFGGGEFSVKTQLLSNNRLQITSRGRFGDITRVVREEVEVNLPSPPFDDEWVVATEGELDIKCPIHNNYYYAEKRLVLNDNYNRSGTIYVGTGPGGVVEDQNIKPRWTVNKMTNPPKPQEIEVEFFEKSFKKKEIEDMGFIYLQGPQNWNDGLPSAYENKMIFVNGDLNIDKSVTLSGKFQSLTIIATGNLHFNGDAQAVLNHPDASLNLIAGGDLHINGGMHAAGNDTAQAFLYSGRNIRLNSAVGGFVGRLRAKEGVHVNQEFEIHVAPMNVDIPGVIIGGQDGGSNNKGPNQGIFAVVSWQEIDPTEF